MTLLIDAKDKYNVDVNNNWLAFGLYTTSGERSRNTNKNFRQDTNPFKSRPKITKVQPTPRKGQCCIPKAGNVVYPSWVNSKYDKECCLASITESLPGTAMNSMSFYKEHTIKWYNVHIWFLQGFLTALAFSYAKLANWINLANNIGKRTSIKLSIFGACVLMSLVFYVKLNIDTHNDHELDSVQSPFFPCRRTAKEAKELLELFHDVHEILTEMNIRHFLIYGSIWGAYRAKGPLPWDYDIDIGIVGSERYSQISKSEFLKPFRDRGITIADKTMISSCFYFTRGDFAQVDIDIFYDYNGWMQRSGLVPWFLYYNYRQYHKFPAAMLKAPLPKMQFADVNMAVPNGGKMILKYLYPKDWDRPFTPVACLKQQDVQKKI